MLGTQQEVLGNVLRIAAVSLLATVGLWAGQSRAIAMLTGSGIHVPLNYFTMQPPPANGTYVDPVFGTTIKRLSDATGQANGNVVQEYSQTSSFNLNDTFFILGWPDGWHLYSYDGNANHVGPLGDLGASGDEFRWSRTNPDWVYFHTSNRIRRFNVRTGQVTDIGPAFVGSITFGNGTGDVSDNERIVVLRSQRFVSVWDLAAGVRVSSQELDTNQWPINGSSVNYATITKDGDSFVLGFDAQGSGRGRGTEQFDVNGNFMVQVQNDVPHAAMGRDVDGTQVMFTGNGGTNPVQPPGCSPGIVKISLDGNATRTCLLVEEWTNIQHFSAHGNDGWLYVSTYSVGGGNPQNWHRFENEVYRVRADGSTVERLAHTRSTSSGYWKQPKGNISISGNIFVYTSDFMGNGRSGHGDTYLLNLTANFTPGAPTALAPAGVVMTRFPTYTWTRTAGAERYLLRVEGPLGTAHAGWHPAWNICAQATCSVTTPPASPLVVGSHTFDVSAANSVGAGPVSASMAFFVAPRRWSRMPQQVPGKHP